jgi:hypothetical protein
MRRNPSYNIPKLPTSVTRERRNTVSEIEEYYSKQQE